MTVMADITKPADQTTSNTALVLHWYNKTLQNTKPNPSNNLKTRSTCFADLHSQLCQFSLQNGLLFLGDIGLLLLFVIGFSTLRALQGLHLHCRSTILLFHCNDHRNTHVGYGPSDLLMLDLVVRESQNKNKPKFELYCWVYLCLFVYK